MATVMLRRPGGCGEFLDLSEHMSLSGEFNCVATVDADVVEGLRWSGLALEDALTLGSARGGELVLRGCVFSDVSARRLDFRHVVLEDCVFDGLRVKEWDVKASTVRGCTFRGRTGWARWFGEHVQGPAVVEGCDFREFSFSGALSAKFGMRIWDNEFALGDDGLLVADRVPVIERALVLAGSELDGDEREVVVKRLRLVLEDAEHGQREWYVCRPRSRRFPWEAYLDLLRRAAAETGVEIRR